ncbi:integrase core domain-containing protein [Sphingobium yanoikuyae]|uniref:integrase core domain-containing protein n=1 Tax=Sphingobium yanoikuyae TaxID=13690 RepID=UPI0035AEB834
MGINRATGSTLRWRNVGAQTTLDDPRSKIEAWRTALNETRPHTSLGFMTPADEAADISFWPVAELGQGQKSARM